jgi:hypothetical protein
VAWDWLASSGQYFCQSVGRISWQVIAPLVNASMALQCSAGMDFSPLHIFDTKDGGTSMNLANDIARPRSCSIHDLSFMGDIVFPDGESLSSPHGEFIFYPAGVQILPMKTVEEVRRSRLRMLVEKHGSMANFCQAIGYARNETATLTRILNANIRHDRDGKPYNMGSPMAREIERKLSLGLGWMDTPPSYSELLGDDDPRTKVMQLMEAMRPDQWQTAVRLLDALAQPVKATGTNGQ